MSFRSSASFGKRQEFIAIAELLRRGFDVYLTLVDDQQIDCVVRKEVSGEPVYMDIQIKARSKQCNPKNAGRFAALEVRNPRPNFFSSSTPSVPGAIGSFPRSSWLKKPIKTRQERTKESTALFSRILCAILILSRSSRVQDSRDTRMILVLTS